MRPPHPSLTLAVVAPRPGSSGPTPPTTVPGADRIHPGLPMSMRPTARRRRPIAHLEGFKGVLQVDGYAGYLTDVLTRIVNGHQNSEIDQLLPWVYRK